MTDEAPLKEIPIDPNFKEEHWFKTYWRPVMAWTYTIICIFDFILAPMGMFGLAIYTKAAYVAWVPLTLQNGGLVHLAFGAIIGIYTWGRTKEKIMEGTP